MSNMIIYLYKEYCKLRRIKQNIVIISNYGNDAIPPTTQVGTVLFVI